MEKTCLTLEFETLQSGPILLYGSELSIPLLVVL